MLLFRFLLALLVIALGISSVGWFWLSEPSSFFYHTIIFLFFGTIGTFFGTIQIKKRTAEHFALFYVFIPLTKVLVYGFYAGFIIWYDLVQAVPNMISFLATYFTFTALEAYFSYYHVTSQRK